jgi:hypothetical protein
MNRIATAWQLLPRASNDVEVGSVRQQRHDSYWATSAKLAAPSIVPLEGTTVIGPAPASTFLMSRRLPVVSGTVSVIPLPPPVGPPGEHVFE